MVLLVLAFVPLLAQAWPAARQLAGDGMVAAAALIVLIAIARKRRITGFTITSAPIRLDRPIR
jgi:hypothetical protein